jgi:ferric-dicitrate binding protein FerR (iron transport regulator)
MTPSERIATLIFRYLRGELSADQERELSEWRSQSAGNEQFFQEETDPENIRRDISEMYANKDLVWQKILEKVPELDKAPETGKAVRFRMMSIAVILLVSLAFGLYYLLRSPAKDQNRQGLAVTKTPSIVPGGNHAVLVLADGSSIQLDSAHTGIVGSENGSSIVKKDSGQLVYSHPVPFAGREMAINILRTPRGGQYSVILSDGTRVWLNAASSLKYPAWFTGPQRAVELEGEAYFEVADNKNAPFHVRVKGKPEILVLGTSFNIMAYPDEPFMSTTLLEGRVKTGSRILSPGQQAQAADSQAEVSVIDNVDTESITAWKNGETSFRNASIREIMRAISRWYDVDIAYKGAIPDKRFMGGLPRNTELSTLLDVLAQSGIHFTVEGKRITVTP